MVHQLTNILSSATDVALQETFTFFKVSYTHIIQDRSPIDKICGLLNNLSTRDRFELHIEAGETLFKINTLPTASHSVDEFVIDAVDVGSIEVSLTVTKKVLNDTVSIYLLDAFQKYLLESRLSNILENLSHHLKNTLHFEVKEHILQLETKTLSFSHESSGNGTIITRRPQLVSNIKQNTSLSGVSALSLLPDDFHTLSSTSAQNMQRFFARICALLSLAYLANVAELNDAGELSIRMYGYKAVILNDLEEAYLVTNAEMLYKIYQWVYDTDTVADRLGLARNVLSLHLDIQGLPVLNQSVWDAIHSNYQIYLKGNIESYLEVKGKIAELLLESATKTSQLSENLLESLKNNALIIITFLLTVVVVNGIKDLSVAAIFSVPYLIVTLVLVISSGTWLMLLRRDALDRFDDATASLTNILQTNYGGVLLLDEINQSLQPTIIANKRQLRTQLTKYSKWWKGMLGAFAVLYLLSFGAFNLTTYLKEIRTKTDIPQKQLNNKQSAPIRDKIVPKSIYGPQA